MGAEPWSYFTTYQPDVNAALQELRRTEFEEGRYSNYDPDNIHDSIEEAMEEADADGTASILDIEGASLEPDDGLEPGSGVAYPLSEEKLSDIFGTYKPTRAMIENFQIQRKIFADIGRGSCVYIFVYKDEKPSEIFFAGYSYD